MERTALFTGFLTLLAGIGIFLSACAMLNAGLAAAGGGWLRRLLSGAGRSPWTGLAVGAAGTAMIQSSGATTVMVLGFVNAGLLRLRQAAPIIYGANIGTTVTGQLVALGSFGRKAVPLTVIFSAFAGIGALLTLFSRTQSHRNAGNILCGFGMLFVGLDVMSGAMEDFARQPRLIAFLSSVRSPLLLTLLGAVLTALIQSSSVSTSIVITMTVTGLIVPDQGIFLTIGSNIGSCASALLAGFSGGTAARRVAALHLAFNLLGAGTFLLIGMGLPLLTGGGVSLGSLLEALFPGLPQTQLAMFHTVFNLLTALLALPLTEKLARLAEISVPESGVS